MCGRFTIVPTVDFTERYDLVEPVEVVPRYNVAPGQQVPVIVRNGGNRAIPMTWGLIPPWAKDAAKATGLINARAETLRERPAFRPLVKGRRCLVPASGFYEWRREGRRKIPFYIRLKGNPLFSFAGLFDSRRDPAGRKLATFAIITTEPNPLVAGLHDRMPAILLRENERRWLGEAMPDPATLAGILSPYPAPEMEAYPVSDRVNSPGPDDASLIRPLPGSKSNLFSSSGN